jgi:hypothetical protein
MARLFLGSNGAVVDKIVMPSGFTGNSTAQTTTLSFWINNLDWSNSWFATKGLISSTTGLGAGGTIGIYMPFGGVLRFNAGGATLNDTNAGSGFSFISSKWYHVVFTWNGLSAGSMATQSFINGALNNSYGGVGGTPSLSASPMSFNSIDYVNAGANVTTYLAELAWWNVILTQLEVTALYQGFRPSVIRPKALIGWWPLSGLQSPEPDLSGFHNNGTLTGTTPIFGPPLLHTPSRRRARASFNLPPITFKADRMMLARF